jgi:hypothetical protein
VIPTGHTMKFFVLQLLPDSSQSSAPTRAYLMEQSKRGEAPKCPHCGRNIGGSVPLPPYEYELELEGNDFGDIIQVAGQHLLVSDRFHQLWGTSGLTGLSGFYQVIIRKLKRRGKKKSACPNYFLAAISRAKAAIDAKASVFVREDGIICPECRTGPIIKRAARIVLESGSWQGEDVFNPRGLPGTVIVTNRFREFCHHNEIKNAFLIDAEKYFFDFYRGEN